MDEAIAEPAVRFTRADCALVQVSTWTAGTQSVLQDFSASFGFALPNGPITSTGDGVVAIGLGPSRWLVAASGSGAALRARLADALAGTALVTDQSDARAVFRLEGPALLALAETVLPIDLDPRAFPSDGAAVTEMGGLSAIIWRGGAEALFVAVPRSMEEDAARILGDVVARIG